MKEEKVVFVPSRWQVFVSVTSPLTGKVVPVARHDCRDALHARTLLTELRALADDLAEFLPGLTAVGYELAEAVSANQSFAEALEASGTSEEDKAYWRGIIAQGDLLGPA